MYIAAGIFLALCILFFFLQRWRRQEIICRVRCMDACQKLTVLNSLSRPLGFAYNACGDIFSSTVEAWQSDFGYLSLYDRAAPRFHMVYDCEPVYFDYDGQTWLIEFWKGQYGINTGGEIGIYRAGRELSPAEYPYAKFESLSKDRLFPLEMTLECQDAPLFSMQKPHRWLAGFRMGSFHFPDELLMHVSLTFPGIDMLHSFTARLREMGYQPCELCVCDLTVSFTFSRPHTRRRGFLLCLRSTLAQWENRLLVRLFCRVTRPFTCTADRLLYLYYFLPPVFRRCLGIRSSCFRRRPRRRHFSVRRSSL